MKTQIKAVLGLVVLFGSTGAAFADPDVGAMLHPAYAQTTGPTTVPIGHARFCEQRPVECQANTAAIAEEELTETRWAQLQDVNNRINAAVIPANDSDLYGIDEFWTYPTNGYGDCEDFVLAKRHALIGMGWSPSTLLITVVREPNGEGHAVLMVRTDRGDLILDNQEGLIKVWTDTPYTYLKRQSQAHAGLWVDITDTRDDIVVAAH